MPDGLAYLRWTRLSSLCSRADPAGRLIPPHTRLDLSMISPTAPSAPGSSKEPKIAVFTPDLGSGGCERMSLFITQSLVEGGLNVDLIVSHMAGVLVDHPVARKHGVDMGGDGVWAVKPLLEYYRRERPQLIIAVGRTAKFVAGIANQIEPSLPFVISVRGVLERPRLSRFWPRAIFGHVPERWLYRRAVAAQATLQAMSDQVEHAFDVPAERVATIHNPLTIDRPESPFPPEHEGWFDRPVIVNAGRLDTQKDQAGLIRAFAGAGLKDRARLLILGVGPFEEKLRRQARQLGMEDALILAGFVPDVRPYLERSTGFALSSVHESFGLVLLEALACGLPVASYDCPTGPRELLDGGRLGRLIQPGDEAALGQAMVDMIDGRLAAPEPADVERHLERFAPAEIASQWVAFVRQCLVWLDEDADPRHAA